MRDFTLIAHDQAAGTDVYCNTAQHITITHPVNIYSGLPGEVSLTDCHCAQLVPEATGKPELSNAAIEGEDVPPATPEAFDELGADPK